MTHLQTLPCPRPRMRGARVFALVLAGCALSGCSPLSLLPLRYDGPEPRVPVQTTALAPDATATEGVAVSPTGQVYFADGTGRVYRLREDDMPEVFADLSTILPGDDPPAICQIAFAPNGDLYVAHYARAALHRLSPDGEVTTLDVGKKNPDAKDSQEGRAPLQGPNFVLWHPAGYVFLTDSEAAVLYRYDPDGGNRTVILEGISYPNGFAFTPDGNAILLNSCDSGRVYRLPLSADYRAAGPPQELRFLGHHFLHKAILDGMLRLADGDYLVCDFFGNQLVRLREDGTPVQRIALGNAVTGKPIYPASLAQTADGTIYVTNLGNVLKGDWGNGLYRFTLPARP